MRHALLDELGRRNCLHTVEYRVLGRVHYADVWTSTPERALETVRRHRHWGTDFQCVSPAPIATPAASSSPAGLEV